MACRFFDVVIEISNVAFIAGSSKQGSHLNAVIAYGEKGTTTFQKT